MGEYFGSVYSGGNWRLSMKGQDEIRLFSEVFSNLTLGCSRRIFPVTAPAVAGPAPGKPAAEPKR